MMTFRSITFAGFVLVLSVFIPSNLIAQTQRQAQLIDVKGKVEILPAGEAVWGAARKGLFLKKEDSIRTDTDASAILAVESVAKESVVVVESKTQVKLADLALDEKTGAETTMLDMAIGSILVDTEPLFESEFRVKTPTAVVGVRGSAFQVIVDIVGVTLARFFSGVGFMFPLNLPDREVSVGAGNERSVADPNQPPSSEGVIPKPVQEEAGETLSAAKETRFTKRGEGGVGGLGAAQTVEDQRAGIKEKPEEKPKSREATQEATGEVWRQNPADI